MMGQQKVSEADGDGRHDARSGRSGRCGSGDNATTLATDERGPEATEERTPRQRGRTPGAELGTAMPASTTPGASAAAPTALGTAAPAQTTPGTATPEGQGKNT